VFDDDIVKYNELSSVLYLGRGFETNEIIDDDNKGILLLCGEIINSMSLNLDQDFLYSLDGEKVTRLYEWNDHYTDHGSIFMIKKDILEKYLMKENKNLIIDIKDERSYYTERGKYSEKRKYLFYNNKNKINDIKLRKNASKIINNFGIEKFEEYVKVYRFFELGKNKSHEDEKNILGLLLIKNYFEREKYKRYNPVNINFIPIKEDENENSI
jgi:hypothetical protein